MVAKFFLLKNHPPTIYGNQISDCEGLSSLTNLTSLYLNDNQLETIYCLSKMEKLKIHASETAWVGGNIDITISNDGTIDELFEAIRNQVSDHPASTEV
jgi:hypothetical protein